MKYLHLFNTKSEHDAYYFSDKYEEPWVAVILPDTITYNKVPIDYKNVPGSIIYRDPNEGSAEPVYKACSPDEWPYIQSRYALPIEAIAIVVIPASHTKYGTCVGISTRYMHFDKPDIGYDDPNGLQFYNMFNGLNTSKALYSTELGLKDLDGNVVDLTNSAKTYRMFCDKYEGGYEDNPNYTNIISPYMPDGSKNPEYPIVNSYPSSYISSKEFSDFLADLYYDRWGYPEGYGIKYSDSDKTTIWDPAATVCKMYNSNGDDWYLPSITELGYYMARIVEIRDAFNKIYNNDGEYANPNKYVETNLTSSTCVKPLTPTDYSNNRRLALEGSGKIITLNQGNISTSIRAFKEFRVL